MITDTVGWRRHQLRVKRSSGSLQDKPCLKSKFKGYCGLWRRECRVREEILVELKEKNEKELEEKKRREAEGVVLSPEEIAAEKKKKDEEPTLERLLLLRLRKRCPFKHPQQGRIKNKGASAEEKLTNLLSAYLSAERIQVPWTLLEDSESDDDESEDEEAEKEDTKPDDAALPEPMRWFTIRTNGLSMVNLSYLRPMVNYFNECQSTTGGMVADLVPQEIDLDSAPFRKCLFTAIKRLRELVCPSSHPDGESEDGNGGADPNASIRSLLLHHNDLKTGEEFLSHFKATGLHAELQSLDMSSNKLESMRMLFNLRSAFPKLLNLSLLSNPITRKPNYREQVRKTLETLVRLDGELIRQPPLNLPHPTLPQGEDPEVRKDAVDFLMDYLGHIELQSEGLVDKGLTTLDEEFAMKYFHPSANFSLVVQPGTILFDKEKYAADERYKLLSAQDRNELETFQIALQNASRDLRLGKIALHRMASGPLNILNAYSSTIYPERFSVQHNLSHCLVSCTPLVRKTGIEQAVKAAALREAKSTTEEEKKQSDGVLAMTDPAFKKTKAQKQKERDQRQRAKELARKAKRADKIEARKLKKAAKERGEEVEDEVPSDADSSSCSEQDEPKSAEALAMIERMKKLGITARTKTATASKQVDSSRGKRDRDVEDETQAPAQPQPQPHEAATETPAEGKLFTSKDVDKDPIIVTLHGTMLWRTPSMRAVDGVKVCFDRVFTLQYHAPDKLGMLHKNAKFRAYQARQHAAKNPVRLFVRNDSLTIRPFTPSGPTYSPFSHERADRLSVVFGLDGLVADDRDSGEACSRKPTTGCGMVKAMMERTNSDKALYELLSEVTGTKKISGDLPGGGLERRAKDTEDDSDDVPAPVVAIAQDDDQPLQRCSTVLQERSVTSEFAKEGNEETSGLIQRSNSLTFPINRL